MFGRVIYGCGVICGTSLSLTNLFLRIGIPMSAGCRVPCRSGFAKLIAKDSKNYFLALRVTSYY